MKKQVILLGAPGCGKGTQASWMAANLSLKHVSTGDLLRQEMAKKSPLGTRITGIMNSGSLVDDKTVLELLKANCDIKKSTYIFDGFPRNIEQAMALDSEILKDSNVLALYFEVDLSLIIERIVNRRSCSKCGAIYNLVSSAPKKANKCDKCSADLIQRKDDNEEVVRNRLEVYQAAIKPVLDYYQKKGVLQKVDGSQSPEKVSQEIKKIFGAKG